MGLESGIQQAILSYLQYLENSGKVYFVRNNSFGGRIQRYDGTTGYMKNNKKGTPDILVCVNGTFVGIEVKSDIGKQSGMQKLAQETIEKCGGVYVLARSVDDVEQALKKIAQVSGSLIYPLPQDSF